MKATLLNRVSADTLFSLDAGMRPGSATILETQLGLRRQSLLQGCRETYQMKKVAAGSWGVMLKTELCDIFEIGRLKKIREPWKWTDRQILVVPAAPTLQGQMQPEAGGDLTSSHVSAALGQALVWEPLRPRIGPRLTSAEQYAR